MDSLVVRVLVWVSCGVRAVCPGCLSMFFWGVRVRVRGVSVCAAFYSGALIDSPAPAGGGRVGRSVDFNFFILCIYRAERGMPTMIRKGR